MYSDDSNDTSPSCASAATSTNATSLYSGYKELMKHYVGLEGASSSQDRLFACPADKFYPNYIIDSPPPARYLQERLHDSPKFGFSSYIFNGGDNVARTFGNFSVTLPGLTGVKLSAVEHPARTILVAECSAAGPWSWHERSPQLIFNDAKSVLTFVDGHVSYTRIYWNSTPYPGGSKSLAVQYDPPASYDYQWSPN